MVKNTPEPKESKIMYTANCLRSMRLAKKGIIAEGPVNNWKYKTTKAMMKRIPSNRRKYFMASKAI